MRLVNLFSRELKIKTANNDILIFPAANTSFLAHNDIVEISSETSDDFIITNIKYNRNENFPVQQENVYYLVNSLMACQIPREDFLIPYFDEQDNNLVVRLAKIV